MQTNSSLQFNLGTFNIPTIVGLVTLIGMIWTQSASRAALDAKVEARLTAIEASRAASRLENSQQIQLLQTAVAALPNLVFRVQNLEASDVAINARIDRQSDSISGLRDGIANITTKIEVLTQRIEIAVPLKRSNGSDLGELPPQLRPGTRIR